MNRNAPEKMKSQSLPKVVQDLLRHASLRVTTDVYMQAVGPQKREAQSNLVKLVRRGAVSEMKPA
jgi:integrase